MIDELLRQSTGAAIAIFLVTAMFSLGLDLTVRQITSALGDKPLLARSLLTNIVVVPLLAIAITSVIPMDDALRTGIILYAFAAGTEGGPKFVQIVGGNTAFALGLLVVMLILTVSLVPVILSIVIPDTHIDISGLIGNLLLVVALPISTGLFLKARYQGLAARLTPIMHRMSMIFLTLLFAMLVYVNLEAIPALQPTALLGGLLLFALTFCAGYLAGGRARENRRALAIMTFARNGSISMLMAQQVFTNEPQVLVMVTVMAAASVVIAVLTVPSFRFVDSRI